MVQIMITLCFYNVNHCGDMLKMPLGACNFPQVLPDTLSAYLERFYSSHAATYPNSPPTRDVRIGAPPSVELLWETLNRSGGTG